MKCGKCGSDGILTVKEHSPYNMHKHIKGIIPNTMFQWYCPACGFYASPAIEGDRPLTGTYISDDEAFQIASDNFTKGHSYSMVENWSDCPAKREYLRKTEEKERINRR